MDTEIDTQRENVKTHMENAMLIQRIRVIVLQAKKTKRLPTNYQKQGRHIERFPYSFHKSIGLPTLYFDILASITVIQ